MRIYNKIIGDFVVIIKSDYYDTNSSSAYYDSPMLELTILNKDDVINDNIPNAAPLGTVDYGYIYKFDALCEMITPGILRIYIFGVAATAQYAFSTGYMLYVIDYIIADNIISGAELVANTGTYGDNIDFDSYDGSLETIDFIHACPPKIAKLNGKIFMFNVFTDYSGPDGLNDKLITMVYDPAFPDNPITHSVYGYTPNYLDEGVSPIDCTISIFDMTKKEGYIRLGLDIADYEQGMKNYVFLEVSENEGNIDFNVSYDNNMPMDDGGFSFTFGTNYHGVLNDSDIHLYSGITISFGGGVN